MLINLWRQQCFCLYGQLNGGNVEFAATAAELISQASKLGDLDKANTWHALMESLEMAIQINAAKQ